MNDSHNDRHNSFAYRCSRYVLPALILAIPVLGCRRPQAPGDAGPKPTSTSPSLSALEPWYAQADVRFEQGVFFKPVETSVAGIPQDLWPLIIQGIEPDPAAGGADNRFGMVIHGDNYILGVDPSAPAVYADASVVSLNGRSLQQLVFLWWYPEYMADPSETEGLSPVAVQGVRMTLDSQGFPMVYEALSSGATVRLLFVSRSLNDAAEAEYGPPLPGRRFAIERSVAERPNVVVARIIEDAPEPIGPIVYLDARTRSVVTLICRCMPSQVDRLDDAIEYLRQPLADIAPYMAGESDERPAGRAALEWMPSRPEAAPGETDAGKQLEEMLRLPRRL